MLINVNKIKKEIVRQLKNAPFEDYEEIRKEFEDLESTKIESVESLVDIMWPYDIDLESFNLDIRDYEIDEKEIQKAINKLNTIISELDYNFKDILSINKGIKKDLEELSKTILKSLYY